MQRNVISVAPPTPIFVPRHVVKVIDGYGRENGNRTCDTCTLGELVRLLTEGEKIFRNLTDAPRVEDAH